MNPLLGAVAGAPIDAIGNVLDKLFTSDDEKLSKQIVLERLRQQPFEHQFLLNLENSKHQSVFVAGWRPAVGWVGAASLAWISLVDPALRWFVQVFYPEIPIPEIPVERLDFVFQILFAILGINIGARTFEKIKGVAR
jgi:hypothetical protein